MPLRNSNRAIRSRPDEYEHARTSEEDVTYGSTDEVERLEGYARDRFSDELYRHADYWLLVGGQGSDLAYVVGRTRGRKSSAARPGIVQLVRDSDGSIQVSALRIDPMMRVQVDKPLRTRVGEQMNAPIEVDVVELAWLARLIDPDSGAEVSTASAYQQVAAGEFADMVPD